MKDAENFIEKSNNEDLDRMVKIIENIPELNLRYENRYYLDILRQQIRDEVAEDFIKILLDREKDKRNRIRENLASLRNIYQAVLECCPQKIPDMLENQNCADQYGNIKLGRKTIDWLSNNHHINDIIREFMFDISKITSQFGSHPSKSTHIFKPTTDTVNSLVYAMKDFIRWFGKLASTD